MEQHQTPVECQVCALASTQNVPIKLMLHTLQGQVLVHSLKDCEKDDPNFVNTLEARRITLYLHCVKNTGAFSSQRFEPTDTSEL